MEPQSHEFMTWQAMYV